MPIEEWTEPIYLLQKGENQRHNFYLQKLLKFNGNITQFHRHLQKKYEEIMEKVWSSENERKKELCKYFHSYDIKNRNGEPPSLKSLLNWSSEDNWQERIFTHTRAVQERNAQDKLKIHAQNDLLIFELQENARLLNLQDLVTGLESGSLNGTQRQAITKSNKDLQDATNRDLGEVKDINQSNINADVTSNNQTNHNLDETVIKELQDVIKPRRDRTD